MTDRSGLVVIRASAPQRERWGMLARAQGRALKTWILDTLDRAADEAARSLTIPDGLRFEALRLGRGADGRLLYSRDAVRRVVRASGLPVQWFLDPADDGPTRGLIVAWYRAHRAAGGEPDAIADALIDEGAAEQHTLQVVHDDDR